MITAIVGGGIGAGATMVAAFGVEIYRRRRRESKVRLALLKEMQAVERGREGSDDAVNRIKEAIELAKKGQSPAHTFIDKTVYQNIGSDLSLLDQEEIDPVVEYYTLVELWTNRAEAYRELMLADGYTSVNDLPGDDIENLEYLEKIRNRAISELQSNM